LIEVVPGGISAEFRLSGLALRIGEVPGKQRMSIGSPRVWVSAHIPGEIGV
jgi:hypothetical protein